MGTGTAQIALKLLRELPEIVTHAEDLSPLFRAKAARELSRGCSNFGKVDSERLPFTPGPIWESMGETLVGNEVKGGHLAMLNHAIAKMAQEP